MEPAGIHGLLHSPFALCSLFGFKGRQVILPLVVEKANPNWNRSRTASPRHTSSCGGLVPAPSSRRTCARRRHTGPSAARCPATPGLSRPWPPLSRTNSWAAPARPPPSRRTASLSSRTSSWPARVPETRAVSTTPAWSLTNCWAGLTPVTSGWRNYTDSRITSCSASLTPVPPSHPKRSFSRNPTQRAGGSLLPQGSLVS